MPTESDIARRLREVRESRQGSAVNMIEHWLRENYDELEHERIANGATLDDIRKVAADLGIKNMNGKRAASYAVVQKFYFKITAERKAT